MALTKEIKGDQDNSYSTSRIATVNSTGSISYRLTVSNASGDYNSTDIVLMDILPQEEDFLMNGSQRYSDWAVELKSAPVVAGVASANYTVYYYTGSLGELTYAAAKAAQSGNPGNGWSSDPNAIGDAKAFIIAIDNTVSLSRGKSLVVTYTAKPAALTELELEDKAYKNAENTFVCHFSTYATNGKPEDAVSESESMESNNVSAMLIPGLVNVGGHVWIDKNENGTWDEGEDAGLNTGYKLVDNLLKNLQITLNAYSGTSTASTPTNKRLNGSDEFLFASLVPGLLEVVMSQGYDSDGNVLVDKLKGENPSTYTLTASWSGASEDFSVTERSESASDRYSYNPADIPESAATDNNFAANGSTAATSERFYLWYSNQTDMTKDIGFVLHRDLTITKVADDDQNEKISGAKFEIYGPFDSAEAAAEADLEEAPKFREEPYITGTDGTIKVEELNWFKYYVIKEVQPDAGTEASGYVIDGATATESAGSAQITSRGATAGEWILHTPAEDSTSTSDAVTVKNIRKITVNLAASKTLKDTLDEVRTLTNGQFSFTLMNQNQVPIEGQTKQSNAQGEVTFDPITIEGVHEGNNALWYYIRESVPEENLKQPGVAYDETLYKVKVEITWNEDENALKATPTYYIVGEDEDGQETLTPASGGASFTNTYGATGSWTPSGTKKVIGRDMLATDTFTFKVEKEIKDTENGTTTYQDTGITGTVSGPFEDGKAKAITFNGSVSYTLADAGQTYVYRISEDNAGSTSKGLTYDGTSFRVKVEVGEDNGTGSLETTRTILDGKQAVAFENNYIPSSINYTPAVTKEVTGEDRPAEKTFTFKIAAVKNPENGATITDDTAEITFAAGAAVTTPVSPETGDGFGAITFTKKGTYVFTISEVAGTNDGYTYQNPWTLTVEVTDDNNGNLNYDATYTRGNESNDAAAVFTNHYDPDPVTYAPKALKLLTGVSIPEGYEEEFTFVLAAQSGPEGGATLPQNKSITVSSDAIGASGKEVNFGDITFSKAGTYTFTIQEQMPEESKGGYSYDTVAWTLTVTVADNNGKLEIAENDVVYTRTKDEVPESFTGKTDGKATITNRYQPDEITFAPAVEKIVNGSLVQTDQQKTFSFKITAVSSESGGTVPMPASDMVTIQGINNGTSNSNTGSFGTITYNRADTYTYTIEEVIPENEADRETGYDYDDNKWTLTVVVTDDKDGTFSLSKTYEPEDGISSMDKATFTNTYTVGQIPYQPRVTKRVTGEVPADREETFKFTLTSENETTDGFILNDTEAEVTIQGSAESGTLPEAVFDAITFTAEGTYLFKITEQDLGTTAAGYSKDPAEWYLKVAVTDENGQLVVDEKNTGYYTNPNSLQEKAVFVNTYQPNPDSYAPQITKTVTGAARPGDKAFEFKLERAKADSKPGVTMPGDTTPDKAGDTVSLTFTPEDAESAKSGTFGEITFTKAGTYTFSITETTEGTSGDGYTYDEVVWTLMVTVTDESGKLNVTEIKYTPSEADDSHVEVSGENEKAAFVNKYQVEPTTFTPKVSKAMSADSHKRPADQTFAFTLRKGEWNPADGASLSSNGDSATTTVTVPAGDSKDAVTGSFGAIRFTKAGTYTFTIAENDVTGGYSKDSSIWTLTVKVEDKGGYLKVNTAETTYQKTVDGEAVGSPISGETAIAAFENGYEPTPIPEAPSVTKAFTGDPIPSSKIFRFILEAADDETKTVLPANQTVEVTGANTEEFDPITFTKAGTYSFWITEDNVSHPGYAKDSTQWKYTVVIKDNGGALVVDSETYAAYTQDRTEPVKDEGGTEVTNSTAAIFTNTYTVTDEEFAPVISKTATGDVPRDQTFTFEITKISESVAGGARMPEDTEAEITITEENLTAQGTFDKITFTAAGTYTFQIEEKDGGVPGYSYDGSVWTLSVVVADIDSELTVTQTTYTKRDAEGNIVSSDEEAAFVNPYSTTEVKYMPQVNKVLTGETTPTDKTFNFTLEAKTDYGTDAVIAENGDSTSVTGAGRGNFGEITFNKRGTYEFTIKETAGSDAGYSYDGSEWTLTVVVQDVNSILTVASHTYTKAGDTAAENEDYAEFSNDYQVTSTEYIPAVEKTVTGTPANDETFTFGIAADSENPEGAALPADTEITVEGSGSAQFDAIDFTKAGTYSFVITETAGGETWYEYDGSEWTLTVTVEDHESVLEVTDVVYAKDGAVQEEAQAASFTNSYHASGTLTLDNFSKILTGSPLAEGQFTFVLADEDGNVLQTVTNGADGSIAFEPLTYDETDIGQTYTYTVSETHGNATGITYDETVYTVNVAVADSANSDGTLAVTTEILNGDQAVEGEGDALPEITFENTFSGSITLTKQGEDGRLLAGAEFTLYARGEGDAYEVYAAEGNAQGIYTTGANGQLQVTNLPANDYYFVETQAPAGYVIQTDAQGEPLHYEFRIGVMDGAAGIVENAQVNAALTVTNPGATNGSIQVTKRVSQIDDNFDIVDLVAQDMTFYVGLFTDAAGTQPYGTDYIRQITMDGVTVSEPVTFTGLPSGTYYVLETTADGTPIAMNQQQQGADGSSFYCTVEGGGSNAGVIDLTVSSEPGTIALQNVYAELPEEGYYWEGSLEITKRVLRDGQAVTADDTFYAGVYQLNEAGAYELVTEVELRQNDTVTVTGLSGPVGGSMTYYVFETDGNGNMISDDPNFMYSVSGEGSVTITETDTTGRVTITNEAVEETTTVETEGSSTTTSTTSSSSGTTSGKSVKTGDTTNIMPALISLIVAGLAVIALGCGIYRRRRRNGR